MAEPTPPKLPQEPNRPPAAKRRGDLATFLIKVAAVTLAALIVLYAAKVWLAPAGSARESGVVPWQEAAKHYEEYVTVEGRVVVTRNTGKVCFLNFDHDWRRTFTAVIFASRFDAFPERPEEHYRDKRVQVTGLVREYKGKPEIVLNSPEQIEIVP
jgi:micrococcal nuclease